MPNTRQAAKRVRQTKKRQTRNQKIRSSSRTALKKIVQAIKDKDLETAKTAYQSAVSSLTKAANKGVLPPRRAARKISRLTLLAKQTLPEALLPGLKKAAGTKSKAKSTAKSSS